MPPWETDHQQRIVATRNEQRTHSHENARPPPAPSGAGTDSDGHMDHPKQGLTGKG